MQLDEALFRSFAPAVLGNNVTAIGNGNITVSIARRPGDFVCLLEGNIECRCVQFARLADMKNIPVTDGNSATPSLQHGGYQGDSVGLPAG